MAARSADGTLTGVERSRLAALESEIAAGLAEFVRVGRALAAVKDEKLYLLDCLTFEAYCQERWGFNRQRGDNIIRASTIADSMPQNLSHHLSSDTQALKLAAVPVEDRPTVLADAMATSKRTTAALRRQGPTIAELDDAVRRYQRRPSIEEERQAGREKMERQAEVHREYLSRPEYTPPAAEAAMDALSAGIIGLVGVDLDAALKSKDVTARRLVLKNLPALRTLLERLEREL